MKSPKSGRLSFLPCRWWVAGWSIGLMAVLALAAADAGDILRGGAGGANASRQTGPGAATVQAAETARTNARDALARSSRAVEAVQRAQQNAQRAASALNPAIPDPTIPGKFLPGVANGLGPGGLLPAEGAGANPAVWSGAFAPTQTNASGRSVVTVRQTNQQALLNWRSFDVGRETHLHFDQSAGGTNASQWIAFNRITDPTGNPSQILGSIYSAGQVYIINPNGIIFGGTSQVNTHTLVASSLPINDNLISRGLLNQSATAQFLFSALPQTGEIPFNPPALPAGGRYGDVTVRPGARLAAPTTAANVGGRVLLAGPNVVNEGTISTPDGQTILAAGLQVGLAAHRSSDPSLRGLDAYVGAVGEYGGTVVNAGLIDVPRGNATLTGKNVFQNGAIVSSTSVALNGRIDLRAEYGATANQKYDPVFSEISPPFLYGGSGAAQSTGLVSLGHGSVLQILPEYGSPDRVVGNSLALRSQINVRGKNLYAGQGSLMVVPNGLVRLEAGNWDADPAQNRTSFVRDAGQIYLDRNALLYAAGTPDAFAPLSQHLLTATLRSSELADSPLQRLSFFRGGDITVDLRKTGTYEGRDWVGTPLADLRGYLNLIERSVAELTTAGGSVSLNAGGSIIVQNGAVVDTSAGWINYGGGYVKTTRLLRQGRLVDIANATPDVVYDRIFTGLFEEVHPRWNITRTFRIPWMDGEHFEAGYLSGAPAGNQFFSGASMALDGLLRAPAISGPRQTGNPPQGGTLDLSFEVQQLVAGGPVDPLISPTPPSVIFQSSSGGEPPPAPFVIDGAREPLPLRQERVDQMVLSPDLWSRHGFASVKVRNPDGNITIPAGTSILAPPRGGITLEGANVTVQGNVTAPGGSLIFRAFNQSPSRVAALQLTTGALLPAPDPARGDFVLGAAAALSAAGQIVDQRPSGSASFSDPYVTNGGLIRIQSYGAWLHPGSSLDVSGGVQAGPRGGYSYGRAGTIEILTGRDLSLPAVDGGKLQLGALLKGYSGLAGAGGTLSIQAQLIQIGGSPLHPLTLQLQPDFFSQGGFSTFSLTGIGWPGKEAETWLPAVAITPGTRLSPQVQGWLAVPWSGSSGQLGLRAWLPPDGFRSPVQLSFTGLGNVDEFSTRILSRGDVWMGAGSVIRTDPLGSVSLRGETATILGSIHAPGGSITIAGSNRFPTTNAAPSAPLPTVYLGGNSVLSTAGQAVIRIGQRGYRQGTVLPGGTISVSGNIVAARGSILDVSGATGEVDLPAVYQTPTSVPIHTLRGTLYAQIRLDSAGGLIRLTGGEILYSDATLLGRAGGPTAPGGELVVSSGKFNPAGTPRNTAEANLVVRQNGWVLPAGVAQSVGMALTDAFGNPLQGLGDFSLARMTGGGFDSLTLGGNPEFRGPISLHLPGRLVVGTGGVIRADSTVQLAAAQVALGQPLRSPLLPGQTPDFFTRTDENGATSPYFLPPQFGGGELIVHADQIEVGNLALQGIGKAFLSARQGDIRGNGTLSMAGELRLQAGQIYPVTLGEFNLFVHDSPGGAGSIVIEGGGSRDLPLSGGGRLALHASQIVQGGVLRAPIGGIQLGWNGSGKAPVDPIAGNTATAPVTRDLLLSPGSITSVSAVDPRTGRGILLPFGLSPDGLSWIDPAGRDITVAGVPAKSISLSAQSVTTAAGSVLDLSGGGDLFAYRWIPGAGGSQDILSQPNRFAVIPGYQSDYAPFAPFNPAGPNLEGAAGYVNSTLRPGERITLGPGSGLPAGTYTLLPAHYALLPGAWLVSARSGAPVGTVGLADGASLVNGYRTPSPGLDPAGVTAMQRFEVAPAAVFLQRAEYVGFTANQFLRDSAVARDFPAPRLPVDSGYLSFSASTRMVLEGLVRASVPPGGRGALIDISSPGDILINGTGQGGGAGILALNANQLNRFNAESLLIGGLRTFGSDGTPVQVLTGTIRVDNAGSPLRGADLILASRNQLLVASGSRLEGLGNSPAETLLLGDRALDGSGDGTLLRVSGGQGGSIVRQGISDSPVPRMEIQAGAALSGGSLVLDSTYATRLDPRAALTAGNLTLNSGQISVVLDSSGSPANTDGLILSGPVLETIEGSARNLSLLSYSSLDFFGSGFLGTPGLLESLSLSATTVRGFQTVPGAVTIAANRLLIDNRTGRGTLPLPPVAEGSALVLQGEEIVLGSNHLAVGGFSSLILEGRRRVEVSGTGQLSTAGGITLRTPLLTASPASVYRMESAGVLTLQPFGIGPSQGTGGLGARLTLQGSRVNLDSRILLPSGELDITATAGDVRIGSMNQAVLDVGGTSQTFLDRTRYTSGGTVRLQSGNGSVYLDAAGIISVSAPAGGGNAGSLEISAPMGSFQSTGSFAGTAGSGFRTGSFRLDAATAGVAAGTNVSSLEALDALLNAGGFTESRGYRIRTGNLILEGQAVARQYRVEADEGSIAVNGTINASGRTGGSIELTARGNLLLASDAILDVSGRVFSEAGKGGSIVLTAGALRPGPGAGDAILDLPQGAVLRLGVEAADSQSSQRGMFTGTLHLRAPRNAAGTDLALAPLLATVSGASHILAEGMKLYDLTGTDGTITTAVQNAILADAQQFLGNAGTLTSGYTAMRNRLLSRASAETAARFVLAPGAELVNSGGNLVLGSATSNPAADWNLQSYRFGPDSAPGILTLRAAQNLTFHNSLSDGFAAVTPSAANGNSSLWLAPLMAHNPLLPANLQSWSYRMTAGADLTATGFRQTFAGSTPAADAGFFQLGKNLGAANVPGGTSALTSALVQQGYQVIRTGSGNIDIAASRSIQLLNPLVSIYTAGTQVADPTGIFAANDFVTPILSRTPQPNQGASLGAQQQVTQAQYSMAGGNIRLEAGTDIERLTRTALGVAVPDSTRQTPVNWLYRRGYVDPSSGAYGAIQVGSGFGSFTDPAASTSWWIDYTNFFQGVGTLGGGDIHLTAGRHVSNVDAVAPTNARAARGLPESAGLLELGGGNISVRAGQNIDAGIYYVERGRGTLEAGGSIVTNSTRTPSRNYLTSTINPEIFPETTWLPTTLFVGKGTFDLQARGNILLGPVANPFLLPTGLGNRFWYKTYFSTYDSSSGVSVTSLGGDVTLRNSVVFPDQAGTRPILQAWYSQQNLLPTGTTGAAFSQPWLRLGETSLTPFSTSLTLAPPRFFATALSGNLNLTGSLTLSPSPTGTLELLAAGSINGLQPAGRSSVLVPGSTVAAWTSSTINVSDANPSAIPNVLNPLAYYSISGPVITAANNTSPAFLNGFSNLFAESGSTGGVIQTKQALHTPGLLHLADPEPVRLFALGGNLTGITLFSPKPAFLHASRDITDISFYLQNLRTGDQSVVSAGRDILPYNAGSPLRATASGPGNSPALGQNPLSGDLQIAGPGSLLVLAGRNLDLGSGAAAADGTGAGIVSIGNARNPYLPFAGADLIAAAGLGSVASLSRSPLQFSSFTANSIKGDQGPGYLAELGVTDFDSLPQEEQNRISLRVFFLILRDTGRNFAETQSYESGFAAIASLFGNTGGTGEIRTQGRSIRTTAGGNINLLAPNGSLTLANTILGDPLIPPGIITESGGDVGIFTNGDVDIGIGRIFTLRGGDMVIWSSTGDIAAGTSSKTVASAPPTRVLIDPQSADVTTDLAGLATGGGIGVLATVRGVEPGSVDLLAPAGVIDAGDAGIRSAGNLTLAATQVLNAGNIAVAGSSAGAPAPAPPAPAVAAAAPAPAPQQAATLAAAPSAQQQQAAREQASSNLPDTDISVEVIGYGGGETDSPATAPDPGSTAEDEEEKERRRRAAAPADSPATRETILTDPAPDAPPAPPLPE